MHHQNTHDSAWNFKFLEIRPMVVTTHQVGRVPLAQLKGSGFQSALPPQCINCGIGPLSQRRCLEICH
eukprot:5233546-Amphidinium_carterae.1